MKANNLDSSCKNRKAEVEKRFEQDQERNNAILKAFEDGIENVSISFKDKDVTVNSLRRLSCMKLCRMTSESI